MMTHRAMWSVPITALMLTGAGCATTTPEELKQARIAVAEAEKGPAASKAPSELLTAKQWLAAAESDFDSNGNEWSVRDRAYIAQRKAEQATVIAQTRLYDSRLTQAKEQLVQAGARFGEEVREKEQALQEKQQQLEQEKQARIQAEAKMNQAMDRLKEEARISQEARGLVISLSGGVLFDTGKTQLRPSAFDKLDRVSDLLRSVPDRNVVVEGHTDNQGPDERNLQLSIARAQAVKEYLVGKGVPASRVDTKGYGEGRPAASNDTPTGRAENRRVDIVVEPIAAPSE
ncbi:MAG: hypothetical protein AMXMBFR64_02560 [Myxococcales bacterium]